MERKTIYLHIGIHKTGTTSIQYYLKKNEKRLLEQSNILYPFSGRRNLASRAHHFLAWYFFTGGSDYCEWSKQVQIAGATKDVFWQEWQNVLKEIEESGSQKTVISSEGFSSYVKDEREIRELQVLLKRYDVYIVIYIRRQDEFFISRYCQAIKTGETRKFESWYKESGSLSLAKDYYSFLKKWESCFGKDRLIIRNYNDQDVREDVVSDFCSIVGIPNQKENKNYNLNITPNVKSLRIIKSLNIFGRKMFGWNNLEIRKNYANFLMNEFTQKLIDRWFPDVLFVNRFVDQKFVDSILLQTQRTNQLVAREYFDREHLF
jgi:hypothetical protein